MTGRTVTFPAAWHQDLTWVAVTGDAEVGQGRDPVLGGVVTDPVGDTGDGCVGDVDVEHDRTAGGEADGVAVLVDTLRLGQRQGRLQPGEVTQRRGPSDGQGVV